ncbi:MAG: HDIG domain-containing protein [Defluviitaleaceae bacterium]|nr:HDIG domain-containing protein [Defluviitaleaceae bacterium]
MRKRFINYLMVALAFLLTCGAIASGAYFRAGEETYALHVGLPSDVTIFAPREIPDPVTTEENRLYALNFALERFGTPIFERDHGVWLTVERNLQSRFAELGEIRIAYHEEKERINDDHRLWERWYTEQVERVEELQRLWDINRDAYVEDGGDEAHLLPRPSDFELTAEQEWVDPSIETLTRFREMPISFTEAERQYLLYMPEFEFTHLWETVWAAAYAVQIRDINEGDETSGHVLTDIRRYLDEHEHNRIINEIAYQIVSRHMLPNRFIDHEATENRRRDDEDNYVRAVVLSGERIVSEGEIVTYRAFRLLEYLGYIGGETDWRIALRDAIAPLAGMFVLTLALFCAVIMYLSFYRPAISTTQKEAGLLFILYVLVLALIWVLREQNYPFLPVLVFPMLVSVLIDRRCAIIFSTSLILIGYFIVDGSLPYLLFYFVSSILICLLSRYTTERNKIILVGFLVTVIQFSLSLAIALTLERNLVMNNLQTHLITAGFAAVNGLLTVIICVGSLPFWEALFGVVTPIKLLDLTNPTNLLLRRLTIEAPGTYHHSLMVANLAESAAYDIGANAHAARVGGYYHDVGKLKFPHFFAENINGENPHEHLEPINSAGLIISHVTYGLTLAAQHRLPQFVRDIIREHHGTSLMQFFYVKAKEADPDVTEDDYRYPYTIPQSRESACVMLADTVEAAVRAMIPRMKSVGEVEKVIRDLVRNKFNDGQLVDSQLSIKDLDTIEASFIRVLKSAHHERIAYPKLEPEPKDPRDTRDSLVIRGMVRKE